MNKPKINEPFTIIPNKLINEKLLSMGAKGMYQHLVSKPGNWSFSVERINNEIKEGKEFINKCLKELEKFNYLVRKPIRDNKGNFKGYKYIINKNPSTENPSTENPSTENPSTENPYTFNNNELNNTNLKNKERVLSHFDFLKLNYEFEFEELILEYKPKIKNWNDCIEKFNDKDYKHFTLITLKHYFKNWIKFETKDFNNNQNELNVKRPELKKICGF